MYCLNTPHTSGKGKTYHRKHKTDLIGLFLNRELGDRAEPDADVTTEGTAPLRLMSRTMRSQEAR